MAESAVKTPTRERIIAAAIESFAKKGFSETSFQEIADRCRITQPAVFHHFKTKSELLRSVIDHLVGSNHQEVSGRIQIEDDAYERLLKHFAGNLKWGIEHRDMGQLIVLLYYQSCFDPEFSKLYGRIQEVARGRIREHLLAGQREGVFHFKEPPTWLAEVLHDALLGAFVNQVTVHWLSSPREIRAAVAAAEEKWVLLIRKLTQYQPRA